MANSEKIDFYDDDKKSYEDFWEGRDYEHEAEVIAIRRLLAGKHYKVTMDYGGGYGRVTPTLLEFSDKVILVDPSRKQLDIAEKKLKGMNVEFVRQTIKDNVPAEDASLDLLVMIRVSHHLPDPTKVFSEINRVLKPGGEALVEIASEADFINRMRYLKRFKAVPKEPVPIGERANGKLDDTPFVNHHPKTIKRQLHQQGLHTQAKLSVSNLRNQLVKKHLSLKTMLVIERSLQSSLSTIDFGPSVFFLVKKS